jgi:lysozyme
MAQIRVVDVSSFQAGFDWRAAAQQGVQGGVAKLSEGTGYTSAAFAQQWPAMKDAGIVRGAYHFARWDYQTDPSAEARHFLQNLPELADGDFVALDIEDSPAGIEPPHDLSDWALRWLAAVELYTHRDPLVYSDYAFAAAHLVDPRLAHYGLWVAAYGQRCPSVVPPWQNVAMWQHTNQAAVAGMSVDESIFFGDAQQLRAYGTPPAPPKPQPPGKAGPRFLITTSMMARSAPDLGAVDWPVQMVNSGAVLDGTGRQTAHWVEVVAGGHPVWVWLANTKPV